MAVPSGEEYQARVAEELNFFRDCRQVHELPDIFHYWSHNKVRPKLEAFGFSSPAGMFEKYLEELCARDPDRTQRFISIGAGNCDREIDLARKLAQGHSHFVIDCLDLNPTMLERGSAAAEQAGVGAHIRGVQADFNQWEPECEYDAVLACQALHHVVNLEGQFQQIRGALKADGLFLISDIVGRNGHLRWPEALPIVQEFWRELPLSHRFNRMLQRQEETYANWDCSTEGFEGIRSQDILPLLLTHFHFQLFLAHGNVIDPFVDRAFGHNFDAAAEWDRSFIDRVHERDEREMIAGQIKPVHMEAVVGKKPGRRLLFHPPFTPEFSVRWPDPAAPVVKIVEVPDPRVGPLLDENSALLNKVNALETRVRLAADSRWLRFGNGLGLGPRLR